MHHPRCLDPKTQDASIPNPYASEGGGCRLGKPGHCRKCPHRGQDYPLLRLINRAAAYAPGARHYSERYTIRPDTKFPNGRTIPQDVVDFLWPPDEREWIEREDRWAERAAYHVAVAEHELIRELLRELHDARRKWTEADR